MAAERITPANAKPLIDAGEATLVSAYTGEKYQSNALAGSIALDAFEAQLEQMPKEAKIIFY